MPIGRITKRSVDALVPGTKDIFLWDEELKGFGLRLTASGAKSYVIQYRMGGRESPTRRFTIGGHGSPWAPDTARKEAIRLLIEVRQGRDPGLAKLERRRQAVDLAFNSYVEAFIDLYLKKRWKQWKLGAGVLRREVIPVLRDRPLPKIARNHLNPIWDGLQDRPAVARVTFATLRKLFKWAVSRGDIDRSPLEGAEAPPVVPARDRVLNDEELAIVWNAAPELGKPFGDYLRMLILTGQRRDEVAGMDWSELNRQDGEWLLPGYRAKNGKPHLVPLSEPAIAILDAVAGGKRWPTHGYVFTTTGNTAISGFSKAKRRLDEMIGRNLGPRFVSWRAHDLRRTLATGLQRLGVRFEVTEAVLNHISGSRGGIAGVYQRYDWAAEKRQALASWAEHVSKLQASALGADGV